MRAMVLAGEAVRNIGSGASRALALAAALLAVCLLLTGADASAILSLEAGARTRIATLADTSLIAGGKVDGVACERLSAGSVGSGDSIDGNPDDSAGPRISGAMRQGGDVTPTATPGKALPSYQITPGMVELLASASGRNGTRRTVADGSGVWMPQAMADTLGLNVGDSLDTDRGTLTLAGIYSWANDGRDTRFGYTLMEPVSASDGLFEECWARQWPVSDTSLLNLAVVASSDGKSQAGLRQVNSRYGQWNPTAAYVARMTRFAPLVALAVGLLTGVIASLSRRLEYAGALHCGQRKADLLAVVALETAVWAGAACLLTACFMAAALVRLATGSPDVPILAVARVPLAAFAGAMAGALVAATCIRERNLFRYFKRQ